MKSRASKDGHRKRIHLHNRDLRVMPADSWHQPDSIENQNKKLQKSSDSKEISTDYILNEEAEIHKLNDDCLMHIFSFLPIADRVKTERGMAQPNFTATFVQLIFIYQA